MPRNSQVAFTLVFVFLAGSAVGALTMRMVLLNRLQRSGAYAQAPRAGEVRRVSSSPARDAVLQRFKTELDLTPQQADKISAVLDDYRHYYRDLQDEIEDVRATGSRRILQVLEPSQREKFEKIMAELQPQLEAK